MAYGFGLGRSFLCLNRPLRDVFDVKFSYAKTNRTATHFDQWWNLAYYPGNLEILRVLNVRSRWLAKSARSASDQFRTAHTQTQGSIIAIWR